MNTSLIKGCASLLQIASGEVFGQDQPIALNLLGSDRSKEALEGMRIASGCEKLTALLDMRKSPTKKRTWLLLRGSSLA